MGTSLSDLTLANYAQTLAAVSGFMAKGLAHAQAKGLDLDQIVETRLFDDMLPFRFQIWSVAHHSIGTIEGLKTGVLTPPAKMEPLNYQALQGCITSALEGVKKQSAGEIDALAGKPVTFHLGEMKLPFTAENYVMSFSLPNFYFHAATAYNILRMKGVPLGKRDFLGQMRMAT